MLEAVRGTDDRLRVIAATILNQEVAAGPAEPVLLQELILPRASNSSIARSTATRSVMSSSPLGRRYFTPDIWIGSIHGFMPMRVSAYLASSGLVFVSLGACLHHSRLGGIRIPFVALNFVTGMGFSGRATSRHEDASSLILRRWFRPLPRGDR